MGWHNHEANIKKAKVILGLIKDKETRRIFKSDLVSLLESMIEDAESGHTLIKELEREIKKHEKVYLPARLHDRDEPGDQIPNINVWPPIHVNSITTDSPYSHSEPCDCSNCLEKIESLLYETSKKFYKINE